MSKLQIIGNPLSTKNIMAQRLLEILESGRSITKEDREKIYLLAEDRFVLSEADIDNLIRKAYQVFNPALTQAEFKSILNFTKGGK